METHTPAFDHGVIDDIVAQYGEDVQGHLIAILHEIQSVHNYLPEEQLRYLASITPFSLQRIYSIATFYNYFKLERQGRHRIHVCTGTACHVKGAPRLIDELERELGIREGETTEDGQFSLFGVRCVGACSLAPVVIVNEDTLGDTTPKKLTRLLKKLRRENGEEAPAASIVAVKPEAEAGETPLSGSPESDDVVAGTLPDALPGDAKERHGGNGGGPDANGGRKNP